MSDKKFVKSIGRPTDYQELIAAQFVSTDNDQAKLSVDDLLDFETFLLKNKTILQNDPQRELLLYPNDDISQIVIPRKYRTIVPGVPNKEDIEGCNLLMKYCCESYSSNWNLVHYKFHAYSESYNELPNWENNVQLRKEVYEIDIKAEIAEKQFKNGSLAGINKQGYLMKGPDIGFDRVFANISSKYFKRRYCALEQQIDGTYILELFKDQQKEDAKMTIVMDFCSEIVKNMKKGKCCFELKMSTGHKSYTFAAENDFEFNDWFSKLNAVVQQNKSINDESRDNVNKDTINTQKDPFIPPTIGTLKRLEQSMNPQLMKYARETDSSIAILRKEHRKKLFALTNLHILTRNKNDTLLSPFSTQFSTRVFVKCHRIQFRLQSSNDFENEQIEPYFTTMCLYDVRNGKKLSENFHFDLNNDLMKQYYNKFNENDQIFNWSDDIKKWALYPSEAIFNVSNPHSDIFLVVRIEKILQGNINQAIEPYLKAVKEPRLNAKLHKNILSYCQKLNNYRMPFAWAARPLFRLYNNEVDTSSEFPAIYRQEVNKLSDEEFLKMLTEYRKPEKNHKLTVIPGHLKIDLEVLNNNIPENCLTNTLLFLKPFPQPPKNGPIIEISEFTIESERYYYPFTTFVNHLYIYPQSLNFIEGQKFFSRSRNIACCIEFRDSDKDGNESLQCIYGRPGSNALVHRIYCYVLHHSVNPNWYEEIKILLPIKLTTNHHLLFSFYHISCDISKKREMNFETAIGYCWIPLIKNGKLNLDQQTLPIAINLPIGYLSLQPIGCVMGEMGSEVIWMENQKSIFLVNFKLDSTVITQDQHLKNLFDHAETILLNKMTNLSDEIETCKILKALHAIQLKTLINFLPTTFNLLFRLLVHVNNDNINLNILRLLINLVHMISNANHQNLLRIYVKYVFIISENMSIKSKTVHDDFTKYLPIVLKPSNTDFLVINKFMQQSEFFLNIMIKSMEQFLLTSLRIKMHRNERFTNEFMDKLEKLVEIFIYYIFNKFKEMPTEIMELNQSLAKFLKKCLTIMDRGYVFKLIKMYIDKCNPNDTKDVQELKFRFLQIICNHEHYISFNLPIKQSQLSPKIRSLDSTECYTLSKSFCKYHFLVGILLTEVKRSLNEPTVRHIALSTLKNLLIKHEFDDRYQNKGQLSRIVALYLPWLQIVLDNLYRIDITYDNDGIDQESNYFSTTSSDGTSVKISTENNHSLYSNQKRPSYSRNSVNLEKMSGQSLESGFSSSKISLNSDQSNDKNSTVSQETAIACEPIDETLGNTSVQHFRLNNIKLTKLYDKYQKTDSKDILACFLFIVKYSSDDQLISWWQQFSESYVISFFATLKLCLIYFKYDGKKELSNNFIDIDNGKSKIKPKANTLPARIQPPDFTHDNSSIFDFQVNDSRKCVVECEDQNDQQILFDANIATEVGLIVLDALGIYLMHFYNNLVNNHGNNSIMEKVIDIFLIFLQIGQSEYLYKHIFALLRSFVNKYSIVLFQGDVIYCGKLCYELLKCCNSRLSSVRQESCTILYLLMRSNFEFTVHKGFTRIHLQVIISVSQMLGNIVNGLNNARFQESLSLINSYASSDKEMNRTNFPTEVKDLTKRIRTVLMATAQMKEHDGDPETLVDLQYSLANSYASTPELRHTWLETMTRKHVKDGNFSEALFCQLHIAALIAEYLHLRQFQNLGAKSFHKLSSNITKDECNFKLDTGVHDIRYSEESLVDQLEKCIDFVEKSERYELSGEIYRFLIPVYEKNHKYETLVKCYETLTNFHKKIVEVKRTGKRFLGRYFRVGFYNQAFFEDDHHMEYIYKEPKITSLSEISERLKKQYSYKFGFDSVQIIMDSAPIENLNLDSKIAYIQVTHVTPYFTNNEHGIIRSDFEKNHDICEFVYETPFTKDGRARGALEEQWKRRTILKTDYTFPYVKKRILVKDRKIFELSPIEVALDEMRTRVSELNEVVIEPIDAKKLQLKLQGSICVQVNAGPLAYASIFLDSVLCKMYPSKLVDSLREEYKKFLQISKIALDINSQLITNDQKIYQEVLNENFLKLCYSLSEFFDLNERFFEYKSISITNGH